MKLLQEKELQSHKEYRNLFEFHDLCVYVVNFLRCSAESAGEIISPECRIFNNHFKLNQFPPEIIDSTLSDGMVQDIK